MTLIADATIEGKKIKFRSMKVAIIGQSNFGAEVYKAVRRKGHEVVGVFTIPDVQVTF